MALDQVLGQPFGALVGKGVGWPTVKELLGAVIAAEGLGYDWERRDKSGPQQRKGVSPEWPRAR